jgi:hypothetical protein
VEVRETEGDTNFFFVREYYLKKEPGPALISSLFSDPGSGRKIKKKLRLRNYRLPARSPDIRFHFPDIAATKECTDNGIAVRGKYAICGVAGLYPI